MTQWLWKHVVASDVLPQQMPEVPGSRLGVLERELGTIRRSATRAFERYSSEPSRKLLARAPLTREEYFVCRAMGLEPRRGPTASQNTEPNAIDPLLLNALRKAPVTFDPPTNRPSQQTPNSDPLILDSDKFPEPLVLDGSPDVDTPLYDFDPNLPLSQPQAESWVARLSPAERLDVLVRIARAAPTQLYRAEGWSHYFAASRLERAWGTSVSRPSPGPQLREDSGS